jgi:small conductance mechanosensitive channel
VTLRFLAEVPEDKIYSGARLLNRELLVGFKKLGVECPFPQLDVHQR